MRWRGRRESANVEDRRGRGPARRGLALGGGGVLLLVVIALLSGQDPGDLLDVLGTTGAGTDGTATFEGDLGPPGDELGRFASVVLADTEDTWDQIFRAMGRGYEVPRLVLFTEAVDSACGFAAAAVGPFYCPADGRVYLDLSFFNDLEGRFGAPGDFAQAYVIAHEVGHHVQSVLGISERVRGLQQEVSRQEGNALSVRLELQADCLAGVWGHWANRERSLLEPGDVEEGLAAAAAIGDDRLQRQATGRVQPESWTHGSSEQRARWLRRGLTSGDPADCDTFGV